MSITLLSGDCRDVLPTLAANSVHTCVTSPPYYALRSYLDASHPDKHREIGSEATPDEYLATMVAVFREVKRVLRPDGTLFLNIGDSYASSPPGNKTVGVGASSTLNGINGASGAYRATLEAGHATKRDTSKIAGLKPKDLLMMPARLALALQADGWYVRSQMPWLKRSCMPESTTDRPTSAIEYVYLLTKSARYFYDQDAVKRVSAEASFDRLAQNVAAQPGSVRANGGGKTNGTMRAVGGSSRSFRNSDLFFDSLDDPHGAITDANGDMIALDVNPAGFADAHFATFPAKLVEPLIRAGTSERGCCSACGAPWRRAVEREQRLHHTTTADGKTMLGPYAKQAHIRHGVFSEVTTTGWAASCACGADAVPATVLDPFAGASTTLLVAQRLQRQAIGIELNPEYVTMGRRRIEDEAGLFADVQTLGGVPSDVEPEIESQDCSDRRSEGSDLGDAQPSLLEWGHELAPT
jgi:DNA modification methylase